MSIEIVSVNARRRYSEVPKFRIERKNVYADTLGLRQDRRAFAREDVSQSHGQTSKAVYVYSAEHYPRWAHWLGMDLMPGAFGEHLTVSGAEELNVRIGDHWTWGTAVFKVSHHGSLSPRVDGLYGAGLRHKMNELGLCGWYLKIVTPGTVPTNGRILTFPSGESTISVLESFRRTQQEQKTALPAAQ